MKWVRKTDYKWTSDEPFNTKNTWANIETPIRKSHIPIRRSSLKPSNKEYKELKKKYRELLQELREKIEADSWKQYSDKQGRIYYYNFITKESQWDDQRIDN